MSAPVLPDESVVVPECDCLRGDTPRDRLHKPRCPRMAAIYLKYRGPEWRDRYLAGTHREERV